MHARARALGVGSSARRRVSRAERLLLDAEAMRGGGPRVWDDHVPGLSQRVKLLCSTALQLAAAPSPPRQNARWVDISITFLPAELPQRCDSDAAGTGRERYSKGLTDSERNRSYGGPTHGHTTLQRCKLHAGDHVDAT